MKSLIIYESAFGNTEMIAMAITETLQKAGEAKAIRVNETGSENITHYDLIIAGSPTQKFTMLPGMKNFLDSIPAAALKGKSVAAFDTRIDIVKINNRFLSFMVRLFGYAAEPIAKKLVKKGGKLRREPQGFFVDDTKGPLTGGELTRAGQWAATLISI